MCQIMLSYAEINVISVQCVLPTGNTGRPTNKKDINVYFVCLFLADLSWAINDFEKA